MITSHARHHDDAGRAGSRALESPSSVYADGLVTLCHADIRAIADALPEPAVILTDPPYGIRYCALESYGAKPGAQSIVGDESTELMEWIATRWPTTPIAMFGSHKVAVPFRPNATLVWEKGENTGMGDLAMPWKPNFEMIFVRGRTWRGNRTSGVLRASVPSTCAHGRRHPNEKPVELMRELVRKAPPGLILDPCCESGATLEAARLEGRSAIGVGIDEALARRLTARDAWSSTASRRGSSNRWIATRRRARASRG